MDTTPEFEGSRLLAAWMAAQGVRDREVALAVKRSRGAVIAWRHGQYRPEAEFRDMLERFTGGAVPASSWRTAEETKALEDVQPRTPSAPEPSKAA